MSRPLRMARWCALLAGLAGLLALVVLLVVPLWGYCPADVGADGCPKTATLTTVLAIEPLAGRILLAMTLVPLLIAALGLRSVRTPGLLVRLLFWLATGMLAVLILWALAIHQPVAVFALPSFVAALLAGTFAMQSAAQPGTRDSTRAPA